MKSLRRRPGLWMAVCAILAGMAAGDAFALDVTFLVGDVKLTRKSATTAMTERTALQPGDLISTGKKSMVSFAYKDGSKIEVRENSRIIVGNESTKDTEQVSVVSGVVKGAYMKLAKDSGRKVYTPTTVCSIRGTEFTVAVTDGADSRVDLEEGRLEVRNPYGRVDINEGERADIALAEEPARALDATDTQSWQASRNADFRSNPGPQGERFSRYMGKFRDNSAGQSTQIKNYRGRMNRLSREGEDGLKQANDDLDRLDGEIRDDMFLNRASSSSIDAVVGDFQASSANMFRTYSRLKREADRIADVQQRNFQALAAVREAYRKAYEQIKGSHQESVEGMRESLKRQRESSQPK